MLLEGLWLGGGEQGSEKYLRGEGQVLSDFEVNE